MSRGNVSSIASYLTKSGKRRIFSCNECKQSFSETQDTVFYDLRTTEERVIMALKMLLVKVDLAGKLIACSQDDWKLETALHRVFEHCHSTIKNRFHGDTTKGKFRKE